MIGGEQACGAAPEPAHESIARLIEDRGALAPAEWEALLVRLRADAGACDALRERLVVDEALSALLAPERRHFANRVLAAVAADDGDAFVGRLAQRVADDDRRLARRRFGVAAATMAAAAAVLAVALQAGGAAPEEAVRPALRAPTAAARPAAIVLPVIAAEPATLGRILTVAALGGQAEIVRRDGRRVPPSADLVLSLGDRVEIARSPDPADHGTRLVVEISGATIDLAPGSVLAVIGERAVSLEAGRLYATVVEGADDLPTRERRLLVRTPDADVGVRGERFELLADAAGTFVRSEGVVEIRARGEAGL